MDECCIILKSAVGGARAKRIGLIGTTFLVFRLLFTDGVYCLSDCHRRGLSGSERL